jgi:hypothetical protein
MTYVPHCDMAAAEYRRFIEVPLSGVAELSGYEEPTNPTTNIDGDSRRYTQVVTSVDNSIIVDPEDTLSGVEMINEDILGALLSGVIDPAFAQVIEESGNLTWIAEGEPGSLRSESVWRVKQIESVNLGYYNTDIITWPGGDPDFNKVALYPLSSLFI